MAQVGLTEILLLALLGLVPVGIATAVLVFFVVKRKKD
jgi:hypothetical protein